MFYEAYFLWIPMQTKQGIFCESRYKSTVLFRAQLTTKTSINHQSTTETMSDGHRNHVRWPQEPSNTIADASPCLRSDLGRWFCRGADKTAPAAAWRWGDGGLGLLFSTRCAREGRPMKQMAPDLLETFWLIIERSRPSGGCNNQLVEGEREARTQQYCSDFEGELEAIDGRSRPQTINNKQQPPSFLIANERRTK